MRAFIVQHMAENEEIFSNIAGNNDYLTASNMSQRGIYATVVELFAASSLLATPIWTYAPFGTVKGRKRHRWQRFQPVSGVSSPFSSLNKAIFIKNMHEHFEPVVAANY